MTLGIDAFARFFAAINVGRSPFAWQSRLLRAIVDDGRWPGVIDAPTGAGKTAVIEVHVFAVALMAAGTGPRVPRRLALVVDRRALVDSHADRASHVAAALRTAGPGVLGEVAETLGALPTGEVEHAPLVVAMLRGGIPPDSAWRDEPAACTIVCATPDMWGSRLLLRGYGTSRHARPREAGLLALDAAVVVDEAHLNSQLLRTARRIAELEALAERSVGVPLLQVVETTATPDTDRADATRSWAEPRRVVRVEAADLPADPALAARLERPKPVRLRPLPGWPAPAARRDLARVAADEAGALRAAHGPTVGCVLDTVDGAVSVAKRLGERGLVVELLVGRLRPWDVAALRARRPDLLTPSGDPGVDVIVATQTIEVGVDADLSALVTELAPGSAIAQRAGRVNRLGTRAAGPVVVIGPEADSAPADAPPYRAADLVAALAWLRRRAADPAGLAPWAIAGDPPPPQSLSRTLLARPEPWDAWLLARTSDALFAEPGLDLWLSDDLEADHDVSLVVREGLPADPADAIALLIASPPRAAEAFPVPMRTAASILAAHPDAPWYLVRDDETSVLETEQRLRPGDVLVADQATPCFRMGVPDAAGRERVADVLEEADGGGEPLILRLAAGAPVDPGGDVIAGILDAIGAVLVAFPKDGRERRAALADVLDERAVLFREPHDARVRAAARHLRSGRLADVEILAASHAPGETPAWIVVVDTAASVGDEEVRQTWTRAEHEVTLADHAAAVADRAASIAARMSLPDDLVTLLREAGERHDEGKRDARFQAMLRGEPAEPGEMPLAKSGRRQPGEDRRARARSGLPTGWRHEQLSAVHAWAGLDGRPEHERRLVTRLVGTSHGRGRSAFPSPADGLIDPAHAVHPAARVLFDEGIWDELLERTDAEWGIWGCAFLEALLRAADGQVSGEGR